MNAAASSQEAKAFTVDEFCTAHRVSRGLLYKLWAAGTGPRIMRAGARVLISVEAAAEWRAAREAATAIKAA